MSSDYDTYGNLKVKSVLLDAPSGLVFHDPEDDSKKATIKVTGLQAGNIDLNLPTTAGTLMTTADSVNLQPGDIGNANLFAADVVDANALSQCCHRCQPTLLLEQTSPSKSKFASFDIADANAKSKLASLEIPNADTAF